MAINFLNNVDFNLNQLKKLVIDNEINDAAAGSGVAGQIYYNSTSNILKFYNGSSWSEVGGGVTTVTTTDGTFINLTPNSATSGAVTVTADLSATGTAGNTTFLRGDNAWAIPAGTYNFEIKGDAVGTTTVESGQTVAILGGSNITATLSTRTVTIDYTGGTGTMSSWRIAADSGTTKTVDDGEAVSIDGGTHISTEVGGTAVSPTVTISTDATSASTASKLMSRDASGFSNVATPASGDSSTKIATTAFVQAALTGLLEFKGGFNANTGILADGSGSDLYSDVAIAVGDYYVVTVAGNFFGETAIPLTPGDSVIAQTAANAGASTSSDFIVVQSDTDLATLTTVGLGNVNASATSGIDVSYTSGTANLVIDVNEVTTSATTPKFLLGTDSSNNTKKFSESDIHSLRGKRILLNGATSGITRTFGSGVTTFVLEIDTVWDSTIDVRNVMIEVTSATSGDNETVYAGVTRADDVSPQTITITFTGEVTNSTYQVLLQNVG
jgi:hypothetical protein